MDLRLGLQLGLGSVGMVRVIQYTVSVKSPHKDRSRWMCVCVFRTVALFHSYFKFSCF